MNISDDPDIPAQINIVPMIDVIFAILTFFIISTLFLTRTEGLPVNLPKAETADSQQRDKVIVSIDANGQVALNEAVVQFEELVAGVEELRGGRSEFLVTINADETVYHGIVVAVMDELRTVEGARLGIATQRP